MVSSLQVSRRTLVFGVLLVGLLAAASEIPEILTLTDNVANDYVSVRVKPDTIGQSTVKYPFPPVAFAPALASGTRHALEAKAGYVLSSVSVYPSYDLLLLLSTQRK